jgi:hypothetical protein
MDLLYHAGLRCRNESRMFFMMKIENVVIQSTEQWEVEE